MVSFCEQAELSFAVKYKGISIVHPPMQYTISMPYFQNTTTKNNAMIKHFMIQLINDTYKMKQWVGQLHEPVHRLNEKFPV